MYHPLRHGAVAPGVPEANLLAPDHGPLQRVEVDGRRHLTVVPTRRIEDDRAGRRFGV